jgi:hypothetical protein
MTLTNIIKELLKMSKSARRKFIVRRRDSHFGGFVNDYGEFEVFGKMTLEDLEADNYYLYLYNKEKEKN